MSPSSRPTAARWSPAPRRAAPARSPPASPSPASAWSSRPAGSSGSATSAGLSVQSTAISTTNVPTAKLVRVSTPTAARERQLTGLGLDVTEHGGAGFLEVVLHGPADAAKLAANNFTYTVQVPDLALQARQDRRRPTAASPHGGRGHRLPERAHHLPAPVRLQRGPEAAGPRAPRPGAPDHPQPPDLRGPAGRGRRDRHQPERPRRAAGVPADGRAPRPRVAVGRARDGVGVRADHRLPPRRRPRAAAGGDARARS